MDLAPNIFHKSSAGGLARWHILVSLRARDPADAAYHEARGNAWLALASLPANQARMVLNLSAAFPGAFAGVLKRLQQCPAGANRQGL
jgi:hypothetical protein